MKTFLTSGVALSTIWRRDEMYQESWNKGLACRKTIWYNLIRNYLTNRKTAYTSEIISSNTSHYRILVRIPRRFLTQLVDSLQFKRPQTRTYQMLTPILINHDSSEILSLIQVAWWRLRRLTILWRATAFQHLRIKHLQVVFQAQDQGKAPRDLVVGELEGGNRTHSRRIISRSENQMPWRRSETTFHK